VILPCRFDRGEGGGVAVVEWQIKVVKLKHPTLGCPNYPDALNADISERVASNAVPHTTVVYVQRAVAKQRQRVPRIDAQFPKLAVRPDQVRRLRVGLDLAEAGVLSAEVGKFGELSLDNEEGVDSVAVLVAPAQLCRPRSDVLRTMRAWDDVLAMRALICGPDNALRFDVAHWGSFCALTASIAARAMSM